MNRLLNLKGINFWLLGAALGLNLFWALLIVIFGFVVVSQNQFNGDFVQVGMLIASFLGPFMIGWVVAKMAADMRGPSYGLIGSFGGLVPIIAVLVPAGVFGIIIALTTLLGGLNGGLFAMRNLNKGK